MSSSDDNDVMSGNSVEERRMLDPSTREGRQIARLVNQAAEDVRTDNAAQLARTAQSKGQTERTTLWAQASHAAVGRVEEDGWPRVFLRLRQLCEANGLAYPFTVEEETDVMARMRDAQDATR